MSIVSTKSLVVIETITVEGFPIRVEISPDGRVAVISRAEAGEVTIIDVSTKRPLASVEVGEFPVGVEISPDSQRAFIGNSRSGSISVIDLLNYQVINVVKFGRGPDGMAYLKIKT